MATNKSSIYGYYGGVSQENLYVPPPSIPYTPQPSKVKLVLDGENAILVDEDGTELEFDT